MAPNYNNESISLFIKIYRHDYEKSISAKLSQVPLSPPQLCPKSSQLLTGVTVKLTPLTYTRSVGLAPPPGLGAHLIERHRYETSLYRSLCAVLCVSMLSAAIHVRVLAEEERLQENTLEQFDTGAADNSGTSMTGDIDTSEIGNESIKNDSDLANPISHQAKPQVSLTSDMLSDSEQSTKAAVSGYQHSDSATSGSVTLTVEWNDPVLGQPTTFHVSATGGSGSYLFRMDAPSYSNPNEYAYESVADPSRGEWTKFTDACASHDFTFTTTATGSYNFRFYLMDKASGVYYLRTNSYIQVADDAYPSVASIVNKAVSQAKQKTDGSEYEMAFYLHDWLLDQLEYDNSLKWSSAESALTRGAWDVSSL